MNVQKTEITAVFLAAVLVAGALTIASPIFVENAEASSEKKKKKHDRDCNYKYEDCYDEYRKYDPRGYDREYKEYKEYDREYKKYDPKYDDEYKEYKEYKEYDRSYKEYDPKCDYDDYECEYKYKDRDYKKHDRR